MPMQRSALTSRLSVVACILAVAAGPALALDPVNTTRRGIAIRGYDPVAYFQDGFPQEGLKRFTFDWNGATWRFATEEHRDVFAEHPEAYAPQYGGYCAWAVSQGSIADIDPQAWSIVEGKLYLNYSEQVQRKWEADRDASIERADRNWPRLLAGDD